MTLCTLRVGRDSPATGTFQWVMRNPDGSVRDTGASDLAAPPFAGACRVVVASDLVLLDRVAVSAAQQRGLTAAMRFLVEDRAIPEPEQLHVVAASAPTGDTLCVAVIDRQWMERMLARLERAGLVAVSACPECLLPELPPGAWTVVWNGTDSFVRTGGAEGFALDGGRPGEPPVALRLALENARNAATAPARIVVRVAPGVAPPDLADWSTHLGIAVEAGPQWRWAEAQARPGLELLQGEFAPRAGEQGWVHGLRRCAILAGMLVILATAGIATDWAVKAGERKALLAEMESIYRATAGPGAVAVDPPLQMSRALANLRQAAGKPSAGDFQVLLGLVAERLLDPERQKLESIAYDAGKLTVSLAVQDPAQLNVLLEELRGRSSIRGLDIRMEPVTAAGRSSLRVIAVPAER